MKKAMKLIFFIILQNSKRKYSEHEWILWGWQMQNVKKYKICRGGSLPDHDGPDADPEQSIRSLESFPSVALHSAHHKPAIECYGKSFRELSIKY